MKMIIANSGDAYTYKTPEPHVRDLKVLISPSLQEGVHDLSVGMTILPPGHASSFHSHEAESETWIVVAGEGEVLVGEEREAVGPESVVYLPPHVKHQIINTGREALRLFWIYTPPGGEKKVLEGAVT
jgi:mannose-6-phosphate isomerase-like protein (cupin superfamily)